MRSHQQGQGEPYDRAETDLIRSCAMIALDDLLAEICLPLSSTDPLEEVVRKRVDCLTPVLVR